VTDSIVIKFDGSYIYSKVVTGSNCLLLRIVG
jgi:hypothetical protein